MLLRRWIGAASLVSFLLFAVQVNAAPGAWPRLENVASAALCNEALQVAKAAFQSDTFYLYTYSAVPANVNSTLILRPDGVDLSGGDALHADPTHFEKIPVGATGVSPRSIYWQRTTEMKERVVIAELPVGWRGDMYYLFPIESDISPDRFLAKYRENPRRQGFTALISDGWRPPLIFRQNQSGEIWLIDVGQPYVVLSNWLVYSSQESGIKKICDVRFRPDLKSITALLPRAVQTLERLLDRSIGRGQEEGTLQPTAGLRLFASHTWLNVALRPWALTEPYNTRVEVDTEMLNWSRRGPSYQKAYAEIKKQYPVAQEALARYYRTTFQLSAGDSNLMAPYALDIAYRSHYTFHSARPDSYYGEKHIPPPNPWLNIRAGR